MGDHTYGYTLDEALSAVGFGRFQALGLVFAGLGWFSDAMEIMLLSFIGPAVKSQWKLSPTQESLISTSVFAGMLIGAYFWGFISDAYGRRTGIQGVGMVTAGAGLLSAFSPDYRSLVIVRCLLGFGVVGGHVFTTWFMEFIPKSNRGSIMVSVTVFWILGNLVSASLAWIVMPGMGWRWLLALSSIPSFLVFVLSTLMSESPRYLHMKGRSTEALSVLEKVALVNRAELPSGTLVPDQKMNVHEIEETSEETLLLSSAEKKGTNPSMFIRSLVELFSSKLLGTTLLLWVVHFGYSFAYYGIVLMISTLSSGQSKCGSKTMHSKNVSTSNIYKDAFITSLAEFPGLLLEAVLVDRLGRKVTIGMFLMLSFILLLPLLSEKNGTWTTALLFGARMFVSAASSTLNIYVKEVYPTSTRSTGVGLATSIGRIGGMVCPLVAVGLIRGCHQTAAIIVFEAVILVSGLCVLLLPFETKKRELTDRISIE